MGGLKYSLIELDAKFIGEACLQFEKECNLSSRIAGSPIRDLTFRTENGPEIVFIFMNGQIDMAICQGRTFVRMFNGPESFWQEVEVKFG